MLLLKKHKAIVAIEALIVMPVLVFIFFFFYKLFNYFHCNISLLNAASQTARYASLASVSIESDVLSHANNYLQIMNIDPNTVQVIIDAPLGLNVAGGNIKVTMVKLDSVFPANHTVIVVMRKEGWETTFILKNSRE